MNLIDIYITEVGKYLPQKSRTDIQEEIHSALQDMLEDRSQQTGRPVDEDLTVEVLMEYGSPEKVAASYLPERYLVGPRLFPAFLKTAQIVLPIIGILALIGLGFSLGKANLSFQNGFEAVLQAIAELFQSTIVALGAMVLIFAILERVLPNLKEKSLTWDPRTLAKISPPDRVKLTEPIAAIVFNFAAIVIFNFYPQVIGASFVAGKGWTFNQLLSETFFSYLPVLNLLWVANIVLNSFLLRRGQWQTWTRWFSLGLHALEVGVAAAMLRGPSLVALTVQDLTEAGPFSPEAARLLVEMAQLAVTLALITAIVAGIVEIAQIALQLMRSKKPAILVQTK